MIRFSFVYLLLFALLLTSCSSDSDSPDINEPDTISPEVTFSITGSPQNQGSEPIIVSNQIQLNIDATDAGGVAKVEAFIDDQKVGEDTTAPYRIVIDISGYASKQSQTSKFQDYTLKIVVTDTAGNTTSKEQIINIDNDRPVISEVSLETGAVINGDTNSVFFEVNDNEALSSVKVYINNELFADIGDTNYNLNINTLNLQDGENTLKIEAIDLAENTAIFQIPFIVDNTGPRLQFDSFSDGTILDEPVIINPEISDDYSEVVSFEIKLREDQILFLENPTNVDFELNPEEFPTGESVLSLIATDGLGNESSITINTTILRLLIKISIPEGFLKPYWESFWAFASEMDGTPIVARSFVNGENEVRIHAPGEFGLEREYMLTLLANDISFSDSFNRMTNIQGLSRTNLSELNLKLSRRAGAMSSVDNTMAGFSASEIVNGDGLDYTFIHYNSEQSGVFTTYSLNNSVSPSSNRYLYSTTLESAPYAYYWFEGLLTAGLDISDFVNDVNIESASFEIIGTPSSPNIQLQILGYENSEDLQSGIYHEIYRESPNRVFGDIYEYYLNTDFFGYSHQLIVGNYLTSRRSLPASEYTLTNWNVDFQQSGRDITIEKSGGDHTLGRLRLSPADGLGGDYEMIVLFDSQNTETVTLPEIPEEMRDMAIYEIAQNQGFDFEQVHITSFDHISNYDDYLNLIIKENLDHNSFSNEVNTEMKSTSDGGSPFKSFNFDQ